MKTMQRKSRNKHRLFMYLSCLFFGFVVLFGSVSTVNAESLRDRIKEEFKAYDMPDQFHSIGTAFTHYDSLDTPGKL